MLRLFSFSLVFLSLLFCSHLQAQTPQGDAEDTAFHPKQNPSLAVQRRTGPITIDGNLNDEGWKDAAHVDDFTLSIPVPYTRPKVKTEAFITYDSNYLYVGMIAHDDHPENIRASMVSRDNMFDDDFMGIVLDTYGDATRAFEIYVNPLGVEGDLFWTSTSEDATYDIVYQAESKITSTGWQMEMRIPFGSLRFPDKPVQDFHMSFWRSWPRGIVYKMSWAPVNFFIPCYFCQLGTLTGIENIKPSGTFELLPALVASQDALASDLSKPDTRLTNSPVSVRPSVGVRYSLGPATGLEAAIKPDFSQVEADHAQVSANTTFALFYPEHRPFFQDGSDLFNTPLSVVYTRSINSPVAVAKAIHRDATTSVAFISGYDENSPFVLPLEEKSIIVPDAGKSLSNIFRATHTLGNDTYIGLLGTDRRYEGNASNTVLGVDTRIALFENVELLGQELWSYTRELNTRSLGTTETFDDGKHTVEFDGERYPGEANSFTLQRFTTGLDMVFGYSEQSPTFQAGNGYITGNDNRNINGWMGYKQPVIAPPQWLSWLSEVDGSIYTNYNWNYDGTGKLFIPLMPELDLGLTGQTQLHIFYRPFYERFHDSTYYGLHKWDLRWSTQFDQAIALSGELTLGRELAHNASPVAEGQEVDLSASARFKLFDGLLIEPTYTFSQLTSDSGSTFYSGSIYFARVTYQFNREFNVRMIVQYDNFAKAFEIDPLVTYKLNPFTSFFIGSTHSYAAYDPTYPIRPSERQIFAKLQYFWQVQSS